MAAGLRAIGGNIEETPDGAIIDGGVIGGGSIESHGDHRIAMSFAVAGLIASDAIRLNDCSNVATSFPRFLELANSCGFALDLAS
jgi:3-phosphoshikimate 1-carboxyvinyltransferase